MDADELVAFRRRRNHQHSAWTPAKVGVLMHPDGPVDHISESVVAQAKLLAAVEKRL